MSIFKVNVRRTSVEYIDIMVDAPSSKAAGEKAYDEITGNPDVEFTLLDDDEMNVEILHVDEAS